MRITDMITRKRDGQALTDKEIRNFIDGYTSGTIPDYQMSALLMAIYFRGMTEAETAVLTDCMAHSGEMLDLSRFGDLSADKHSTGGVGDKTTFIVAPLAACLGCKTAKMSGRGLGHTGGTIDKLESIPGYRTSLGGAEFLSQVERIGVSVIGANADLAPADKKLYALRDVTGTVESVPLIASSIMSKKLAAGAKNIVLDVTVGSGAFMKTKENAEILARAMVDIGTRCGRRVTAVLTDMDQPLGRCIGNALEIEEVIAFLRGDDRGLDDLREVSLTLAAHMASLARGIPADAAYKEAETAWKSGRAYETFLAFITAQGGDADWIINPGARKKAPYETVAVAEHTGYLSHMNAEEVGITAMMLGAGRQKTDDKIDPLAGIRLLKKVGDTVSKGDPVAVLYTSDKALLPAAERRFSAALEYAAEKPAERAHILGEIAGDLQEK